jgi:hypothetical protein
LIGIGFMRFWARVARRCGARGSLARRPVVWTYVPLLVLLIPIVLTTSALLTPLLRVLFARRLTAYLQSVER